MRRAAAAVALMISGCTCDTGAGSHVYACTSPADCLDGWSCVRGVCFPGAEDDGGAPDSGAPDSGAPDSGAPDSGAPDSGAPDSGAPDSGAPDSGAPDSGAPDAGAPDSGLPHLRTFSDDFAAMGLDAGEWGTYENGGARVSQPGELVITVPIRDAGYAGIYGRRLYDMRDGGLVIDLVDSTGCTFLSSCEMYFSVNVLNPDGGRPDVLLTTLYSTRLHAYVALDGGVSRRLDGFTFVPATMHLMRMREDRGTVFWEYSDDGGAWTSHFQMATPLDLSAVQLEVGAGTWDNEDAGVRAAWRNLRGF